MSNLSKPVKIISAVLAIALILAAVTGVAIWSARSDSTKTTPGIMVEDKLIETPGAMMKLGAHEVSFDEYRHFYLANKNYIETQYGGATMWASDFDHAMEISLKKETENAIQRLYAWQTIAAELGVSLSEEENQEILDDITKKKTTVGVNFQKTLEESFFANEETSIKVTQMQKLQIKTQEALTEQLTKEHGADIGSALISAQHILITPAADLVVPDASAAQADAGVPQADASAPEDTAEDALVDDELDFELEEEPIQEITLEQKAEQMAQAKLVADELVRMIRESEDPLARFNELRTEYDSDAGQPEEGYTFGEGEMVTEFYEGALALQPGEISEPVKTDFGYHIILRQEVDPAYLSENLEALVSNKLGQYQEEKLQTTLEDLVMVPGEYYIHVKPDSVV